MKKADLLSAILFLNILLFIQFIYYGNVIRKNNLHFMAMTCCALLGIVIVEFIKRKKANK
jgi:hypothetical protein